MGITSQHNHASGVVTTTLNVVNGTEVECHDETLGQFARVVIRNSKGRKVASMIATIQGGRVVFNQQSLNGPSERHFFIALPNQQFCGASLSDSFMCCLPPNHKIHNKEEGA